MIDGPTHINQEAERLAQPLVLPCLTGVFHANVTWRYPYFRCLKHRYRASYELATCLTSPGSRPSREPGFTGWVPQCGRTRTAVRQPMRITYVAHAQCLLLWNDAYQHGMPKISQSEHLMPAAYLSRLARSLWLEPCSHAKLCPGVVAVPGYNDCLAAFRLGFCPDTPAEETGMPDSDLVDEEILRATADAARATRAWNNAARQMNFYTDPTELHPHARPIAS
ncbi:hypothetical protein NUW58_g6518 [Xylaria curta]|uniref:Uncharacterized protein n=1 Tax=Xylaria curta TaxID=42375 RepID=A0ACC1NUK5_9PEZI|nr:hypothetical protein NUW58_g6518 [Xylaria curta]